MKKQVKIITIIIVLIVMSISVLVVAIAANIFEPDTDKDGILDKEDIFPNDPTESVDSDGDGYGDNSDVFPNNKTEWLDTDKDGYGDNTDAFPNDPNEWKDSDHDGIGDNSDTNKPEFMTLDDGTIITGDFDKFLITESTAEQSMWVTDHPEQDEFTALFTGRNIAGKILNSVNLTIRFYDINNKFLSENTTETKYLPPDKIWRGEATRLLIEWEGNVGTDCNHVSYHITVS